MTTSTLSSKGQITIPKEVRDSLRLRTGDRISFVITGDSEVSMKPVNRSVNELFGKLYDPKQVVKTVEEMNAAIAERMRSRKS